MQRHFNLLAIHHAGVRLNRDNFLATIGFRHWLNLLSRVFYPVPCITGYQRKTRKAPVASSIITVAQKGNFARIISFSTKAYHRRRFSHFQLIRR